MEEEIPPLINMNPVPKELLVVGKRYYILCNYGLGGVARIGEFRSLHIYYDNGECFCATFNEIAVEMDANWVHTPGRPRYHDPNEERYAGFSLKYYTLHEYVHAGH